MAGRPEGHVGNETKTQRRGRLAESESYDKTNKKTDEERMKKESQGEGRKKEGEGDRTLSLISPQPRPCLSYCQNRSARSPNNKESTPCDIDEGVLGGYLLSEDDVLQPSSRSQGQHQPALNMP